MEETTKKSRVKRFLERIGVYLHFGPRFYKVLATTGVLGLAVMGYMVHYTTTPGFCNSCHIMKPYYDAWKTSKHKDVSCIACHYSPETKQLLWAKFQAVNSVVQYVTKKYSSKPYAQIEDASCLRSGCPKGGGAAGIPRSEKRKIAEGWLVFSCVREGIFYVC